MFFRKLRIKQTFTARLPRPLPLGLPLLVVRLGRPLPLVLLLFLLGELSESIFKIDSVTLGQI